MKKNYKEPKMKPLDLKGEALLGGSNDGVASPEIQGKTTSNEGWSQINSQYYITDDDLE